MLTRFFSVAEIYITFRKANFEAAAQVVFLKKLLIFSKVAKSQHFIYLFICIFSYLKSIAK